MTARRTAKRVLRAGLVVLAYTSLASSAYAAPALHVIPFPGTPDASPWSHIIFSSLAPSEIRVVSVVGASSGAHPGHLVRLPDGAGTSFVPEHRFAYGERVTVTAVLSSRAAGTASGDPDSASLSFSFGVATNAGAGAAPPPSKSAPGPPARSSTTGPPSQNFPSEPGLHPPEISRTSDPDGGSGDIFLAPWLSTQSGPMILNSRGQLVWFHRVVGFATNLEVERYRGQPVLTWWQQKRLPGPVYSGTDVIMSRSYRTIAMLHAGYGYRANLHEFQLTPRGTALILAEPEVMTDLSAVGGPSKGAVIDCVIQELDVKTNQVVWEWHALGHIPLTASFAPSGSDPYDFCHVNSIQQLPNGNLLVSARNTWSVYEIDKQTGRLIWTLGGRHSDFQMGSGTNFEWEHDAHLVGDTLTLFDDAAGPQEERQSSAKVLRLNTSAMRVSLVRRYTHSPPVLSARAGSIQILPNGDVFVGWGRAPDFAEYTPSGRQIFNGAFPLGIYSYRAYRFPWSAQPATPPTMTAAWQSGGTTKVYASWNGATDVAAWRVLGGSARGSLRPLGSASRTGFETTITLKLRPRYVAVQALGLRDKLLGRSRVEAVQTSGNP